MKNLLESVVFRSDRFKKLAGIKENVSGVEAESPEIAANLVDKLFDRISDEHSSFGSPSHIRDALDNFLSNAAEQMYQDAPDLDKVLNITRESKPDGYGESSDSGVVSLLNLPIATWSAMGDGYGFSVGMDEQGKRNFAQAYKKLFNL